MYNTFKNDSKQFAKYFLPHIVTEVPPHHELLYSIYDKRYAFNAFVMFRGSGKTTVDRLIKGLHDVTFKKEPFILWCSESIGQASDDLVGLQNEVEDNELVHDFFGDLKGPVWNKEQTEFANGVAITVKGYGSRIRGIKWKAQRPTKISLDDFESKENSDTEEKRREVRKWISRDVEPCGTPGTAMYFLGTIVHPSAYMASVEEKEYFKPPNGIYLDIPIEKDGMPIWASRFPLSWIQAKEKRMREEQDYAGFRQEYYNEAAADARPVFNPEAITEFKAEFDSYSEITYLKTPTGKIPINVSIGVDPASTFQDRSSDTVFFVLGITPQGREVILHIDAVQLKPSEQRDHLFRLANIFHPRNVTIETIGYQTALADIVREEMNKREQWFPISEFKKPYSKDRKFLEGVEPRINGGYLSYLPGVDINLFKKQLKSYTANERGKNDTIDGYYLSRLHTYPPNNFDVDEQINEFKNNFGKKKRRKLSWFTT